MARRFRFWSEGWVVKLAGLIPHPVLANPERILINFASILIGLSAAIPPEGSAFDAWGNQFAWSWGLIMALGGLFGCIGQMLEFRPAERVGAIAVGGSSVIYATALLVDFGPSRVITSIIFFALFAAKVVRLLRLSAVRFAVQRHLRELEENGGYE